MATEITVTEHPHIIRIAGVRFGSPIIRGTGLPVWLIVSFHKQGSSIESMLQAYPELSPAQIYDALSYYFDHQAEIEQELLENSDEYFLHKHNLKPDARGFIRLKV